MVRGERGKFGIRGNVSFYKLWKPLTGRGYESHSLRHIIQNKQVAWSPKVHHDPRAGPCFVFGMSDMQFCKAQVRAVKAKTDCRGISSSIGEGEFCRPRSVRPLLECRTKSHTGGCAEGRIG
jgi:hypothetical protein